MAPTFSTYDVERLGAAKRTLLSTFDYASKEGWLSSATDQIKKSAGADAEGIQGLGDRLTLSTNSRLE